MVSLATRLDLHKGPVGSLRDRCAFCSVSRPKLLLCTGCRAVRYCSREHQVEDRPAHKTDCISIKKQRAVVEKEADIIRNLGADSWVGGNAFEKVVGRFYGFVETRDYIRARFYLADNLRLMGTLDGVRESADHIFDMLRLNRRDNLGQRDFLPALLLRLDRDQKAYDIIKWWSIVAEEDDVDVGDPDVPYMNLQDEDVLEEPTFLLGEYPSISCLAALLLLKLKLLVDIRSIKATRWVLLHKSPLPTELRLDIEADVVRSPISLRRFVSKPTTQLNAIEIKLSKQVRALGTKIFETCESYVPILFDPDEALVTLPESYGIGSYEHAILTLQQNFSSMWETAGVFEIIKDARTCAANITAPGIGKLQQHLIDHNGPDPHRSPAQLLKDVSLNRMWEFLDWAVQNASYPGRWSERPSERYTKKRHA